MPSDPIVPGVADMGGASARSASDDDDMASSTSSAPDLPDLQVDMDEDMSAWQCASGERVQANRCVACAAGTTRPAGDDASGPDTQCQPIVCGLNERVQANRCVACAAGTTRPAGDDASGPDTQCGDVCSALFGLSCAQVEQAYLKDSQADRNRSSWFGHAVAVDGDTLVVGTPFDAGGTTGVNGNPASGRNLSSGAVYVFTRAGSVWTQQAYIKASNAGSGDLFGYSVSLDGDTLAVGAYNEQSNATGVNGDQADNSEFHSGAVYVRKIAP